MKQTLVLFDTTTTPTVSYAVHPADLDNKDYKPPVLEQRQEEAPLPPIGIMSANDDGSWTIRLPAQPSGLTFIAKPLA